jgi:hypothetical protein
MRQLGGAFGIAVLVAVFAGGGSYASPQAFNDGFVAATVACAGISLMGALAGTARATAPTQARPNCAARRAPAGAGGRAQRRRLRVRGKNAETRMP